MLVICQTLSTLYPRWKAVEIANIRLSVGLTSSSSTSSTKSFCSKSERRGIFIPNYETDLGKSSKLVINCTNRLLDRLLESPTNTHNLSDTLHTATEKSADAIEFLQIPSWDLHNNIIQTGFKTSTGDFRDGVLDDVQGNTEAEFCCDEGERISSRF